MTRQKMTLDEINGLKKDIFVRKLGVLFEGPPWIVARAWSHRPFTDLNHFHQTLCSIMYQASVGQQVALLCAHPDLVGRAALAGTLSPASTSEQASAGLDRLTSEEIATFQKLNQAYRARFGFPFVICARENKKESILAGLAARLSHSYAQEIALALTEVTKICALRLHDLVEEVHTPEGETMRLRDLVGEALASQADSVRLRDLVEEALPAENDAVRLQGLVKEIYISPSDAV